MDNEANAKKAVDAIMSDLEDRKGIGNELEAVHDEYPSTYRDIKRAMTRLILKYMVQEES